MALFYHPISNDVLFLDDPFEDFFLPVNCRQPQRMRRPAPKPQAKEQGQNAISVINNESKYLLSVDVSPFNPDELKVNLEGRALTIEGKQEQTDEHGSVSRSFVRKFHLPEDLSLSDISSSLNEGRLIIEVPKNVIRSIPINIQATVEQPPRPKTPEGTVELDLE